MPWFVAGRESESKDDSLDPDVRLQHLNFNPKLEISTAPPDCRNMRTVNLLLRINFVNTVTRGVNHGSS